MSDDKGRERAARLRDIERQNTEMMRAAVEGRHVPVFVAPPPLTVWAVEEHVEWTGTFVHSLWATQELAEGEVARLCALDKRKRDAWSVEEYEIHMEPREGNGQ